jgi:hypothetical protein
MRKIGPHPGWGQEAKILTEEYDRRPPYSIRAGGQHPGFGQEANILGAKRIRHEERRLPSLMKAGGKYYGSGQDANILDEKMRPTSWMRTRRSVLDGRE